MILMMLMMMMMMTMMTMIMMMVVMVMVIIHLCYGPLKVSTGIPLRKLNEQNDILTIWKKITDTFHSNGRSLGTKRDVLDPLAPK